MEQNSNIKKRSFKLYVLPAILAAVLIFMTFGIGVYVGAKRAPSALADNGDTADMKEFWQVWNALDTKFVGDTKPNSEDKVYGAIQGLAASYKDPYTVFFPPEESKAFAQEVSGAFEGVGMEVGLKENQLVVVAPLPNTPASRAGIIAGDKILKIDGKDTNGLSTDAAVKLIRGKGGTTVVLTMMRSGKADAYEVSLVRERIDVPAIRTEARKDGVFVIHFSQFTAPSVTQFQQALREFVDTGDDKLIIDLRNNPGGYLEAAVEIASYFLAPGKVVVTEDYGGKQDSLVHRSRGYNLFNDKLRLLILLNGGSASASEILAGALHDQGKARIVGEKSFGKGSVQELINLDAKTSLKVTVARWLTPNGTSISKQGIVPDIEIKMTREDFEKNGDIQLEKAAEILNKETATSSTARVLSAPPFLIVK